MVSICCRSMVTVADFWLPIDSTECGQIKLASTSLSRIK